MSKKRRRWCRECHRTLSRCAMCGRRCCPDCDHEDDLDATAFSWAHCRDCERECAWLLSHWNEMNDSVNAALVHLRDQGFAPVHLMVDTMYLNEQILEIDLAQVHKIDLEARPGMYPVAILSERERVGHLKWVLGCPTALCARLANELREGTHVPVVGGESRGIEG